MVAYANGDSSKRQLCYANSSSMRVIETRISIDPGLLNYFAR
jgi:hypothetical protein